MCQRCGDEVDAPGDRLGQGPGSGWTHHEWRLRAATATAAATAARAAARRPGRKRGKLAAALDRLELQLLGPGQAEPDSEERPEAGAAPVAVPTRTYCTVCLAELGRSVQSRQVVADILRFRRGETGTSGGGRAGLGGSSSPPPAVARRRSPEGRPLA
jgi:hypothetical protein